MSYHVDEVPGVRLPWPKLHNEFEPVDLHGFCGPYAVGDPRCVQLTQGTHYLSLSRRQAISLAWRLLRWAFWTSRPVRLVVNRYRGR